MMDEGLLSLKWNNHRSSFLGVISSLRNKASYADVTLACEGKFYRSHKIVLSTCSEYFQEMFQLTDCKHPIIVLKDIPKEDLEALLNYMYLGEVNVLQERLTTLIKSAECLKIKGLAVPDDAPEKPKSKREAEKYDSRGETKRRCLETDHKRKSNTSRDSSARGSEDPKHSLARPSSSSYTAQESPLDSSQTSNPINNTAPTTLENVYIKQETPDCIYVPEEDSKEGIRESLNPPFSSPDTHGGDSPSQEDVDHSKIETHWEVDDRLGYSGYTSAEDQNYDASNEPSSSQANQMMPPTATEGWKRYPEVTSLSFTDQYPYKCYVCEFCSKAFNHKGNFQKHLKTHTGEKPFACTLCDYRGVQKIHVINHVMRNHKIDKL